MILLAVVLGLYAIGAVGYYKMSDRMMVEMAPDVVEGLPRTYRALLVLMAVTWPLLAFWALVKEAAK